MAAKSKGKGKTKGKDAPGRNGSQCPVNPDLDGDRTVATSRVTPDNYVNGLDVSMEDQTRLARAIRSVVLAEYTDLVMRASKLDHYLDKTHPELPTIDTIANGIARHLLAAKQARVLARLSSQPGSRREYRAQALEHKAAAQRWENLLTTNKSAASIYRAAYVNGATVSEMLETLDPNNPVEAAAT